MADRPLRIGTRASQLALWQAHHVQAILNRAGISTEVVEITTTGDKILDVPLSDIGDKALFTKELDVALLDGRIDLAVHSLKDLPTTLPDGIALAAISDREDPSDAFVAHPSFAGKMAEVPPGGIIATSSLRRTAQLRAWRPDIEVVPVRGNVNTRLRKLDESTWHGIILAYAGLARLGMHDRIRERIDFGIMLPAVSQGVLGVVCREGRVDVHELLRTHVDHPETAHCVAAERAFLRTLEGGCSVPVGAHARIQGDGIALEGVVASLDGTRHLRKSADGPATDPETLGISLANRMLANGADSILAEIRANQPAR